MNRLKLDECAGSVPENRRHVVFLFCHLRERFIRQPKPVLLDPKTLNKAKGKVLKVESAKWILALVFNVQICTLKICTLNTGENVKLTGNKKLENSQQSHLINSVILCFPWLGLFSPGWWVLHWLLGPTFLKVPCRTWQLLYCKLIVLHHHHYHHQISNIFPQDTEQDLIAQIPEN